jgi:hypothetical protein
MTRKLLGWGPLTAHDGPISVAGAFRLEKLVYLTRAAGSSEAIKRRHWPWFRVSVVIPACPSESAGREIAPAKSDFYPALLTSAGD